MEKIKIPTRKLDSYKEFLVVKEFLKNREKFTNKQLKNYFETAGMPLTKNKLNALTNVLIRRKKVVKPSDTFSGKAGKSQTYTVLNDIEVLPPKGSEIKQRRLPIEPKEPKKEVLTLEDVERIGEMDLAFIGYTIRTETEILSKKYEVNLIQLKKAQEELKTLEHLFNEAKLNHAAQIQTLLKHQKEESDVLKKKVEGLKESKFTIEKLNDKITNLNIINENLKNDVQQLKEMVAKVQRGDKTFKLIEVAKFTTNKPSHLD